MRTSVSHTIQNPDQLKQQLLLWSQQFRETVFLDSNNHNQQYSCNDAVLAVDALTSIQTDYHDAFNSLDAYQQTTQDWLFGYLAYDLKNDTEKLVSENYDGLDFPDLFFFQPKKLFLLKGDVLETHYLNLCADELDSDLKEILNFNISTILKAQNSLEIKHRITESDYLSKAHKMLEHIHRGDIYEANFCIEFYAENAEINPAETYIKLNTISQPPFAVFLKNNRQYLLSASPERYLQKQGSTIITQPIKGTARRSNYIEEDEAIKQALACNEKERSENIMIVDLVRNDLSKTAQNGSVQVQELCEPNTFKQVHHLISTVTATVGQEHTPVNIIKSTFPMGSMTGAPKISAMQIIESLEETRRGLYSGAVGYFTPQGDFDFNVVIRSILYNQDKKYVSFSVGSAITAEAVPEQEYQECLLKAKAMHTVLMDNN